MMIRLLLLVLLGSCIFCVRVSFAGTSDKIAPVVTGTVLDEPSLEQGGDLALTPFKAGPQAEANDELDRLSMRILKGIKDSIDERKNSSLRVVEASDGQPKIALQGYIEEFSRSHSMIHGDQASLKLVGEVWLISTGERLLTFSTGKKFNPKKEKPGDVAYDLGHDIGDYIGIQVK